MYVLYAAFLFWPSKCDVNVCLEVLFGDVNILLSSSAHKQSFCKIYDHPQSQNERFVRIMSSTTNFNYKRRCPLTLWSNW